MEEVGHGESDTKKGNPKRVKKKTGLDEDVTYCMCASTPDINDCCIISQTQKLR